MTKKELIVRLQQIVERQKTSDCTSFDNDHIEADKILLQYINDERVTEAFETIEKWYA